MAEKEEKKIVKVAEKAEKAEKPARKEKEQDKSNWLTRTQDSIRSLYREMVGELRKVSWPTMKEALNLTRIVLIVMVIMMIILGGLDRLFTEIFKWLVNL